MKKALSLLTALMFAMALLAGCGSDADEAPAEAPAEESVAEATDDTADEPADEPADSGDTYKVILITMDQMDQHWVNVDAGAQRAVEELGNIEYRWFAPDVKDDAKQIEQINNAVADNPDVIMVAANGPDAVTGALQEAADAGVKIVYVDSPANFDAVATLATDNEAAGTTAGETMLAELEAQGVTSGQIGIISVNAATASTVSRDEGFRKAFEGTDFELLETQFGEGDAANSQALAENFISQGVVGLYGTNEGSTVGVGNAIAEDGNNIVGVGFDVTDTITGLIKDGSLLATMAQNPDVMGYEGVKVAAAAAAGTHAEDGEVIDTRVSVLTADTI